MHFTSAEFLSRWPKPRSRLPAGRSAPFGGGPVVGIIGGKPASAAGRMFGLELEGLSAEDRRFEVERRFVRFASATTKNALSAPPAANPQTVAKRAAAMAGRRLAPGLIRQGAAALSDTVNGKGGAAIGGELGEASLASSATCSGKAESAHRAGN
jgi:hypothetical protein